MNAAAVFRRILFVYTMICFCLLKSERTAAQDSNRCWNQALVYMNTVGGSLDTKGKTLEECQALCYRNATCRGIDWDYINNDSCWVQFDANQLPNSVWWNVTHFTLSDCTYLNRCWDQEFINQSVNNAAIATGVKTVEDCQNLCLNNALCHGVDWNYTSNRCFLQFNANQSVVPSSNITHWSLIYCSPWSTTTPTQLSQLSLTDTTHTQSTKDANSNSVITGLIAAVIALAVLLGISILIIIILIVILRKERLSRKSTDHVERAYEDIIQRRDMSGNSTINNYAELQPTNTPAPTLRFSEKRETIFAE